VARAKRFLLAAREEWKPGLIAGALSIVTYGLALWAYRLGDTPRLAALRETSILFGVAIAVLVLRERLTPRPDRRARWPSPAGAALLLLGQGTSKACPRCNRPARRRP
jgi:4-amino-4-deoxy-L-arabinose transferase-like glycosyltransferase